MSITACDNWVGQLVGAVERGPDWSSTAVFITWDDCGCFYDQVPPPDSTRTARQEGPRVPLIIVSPYAKPGYTDTTRPRSPGSSPTPSTPSGCPRSGANDAAAYPFTNAFDYAQATRRSRYAMVHRPLPASAKRIRLTRPWRTIPT